MEALATSIIGGIFVYVVGQFLMKAVVDPAIEVKKLIGKIVGDIDFYANQMYGDMPLGDEAREKFRTHACVLREKMTVVLWYEQFRWLLQLPPSNDVYLATGHLIGHSNYPKAPLIGFDRMQDQEIKKLLGIRS
jgi:hypothetical protein